MIDHLTLPVSDLQKSKEFYLAALEPLGYELVMEFDFAAGFGVAGKPDFWISAERKPQQTLHVAFRAEDHEAVQAFYEAAIKAGAKDNGKPGPRAIYHPNYYGAFVLDPDGHNMEAVCRSPQR